MQAQAERERQARVILGDSERQVAEKFGEAAKTYANNPVALHLWAMNMLYEGLKTNSTIVIVPSSAIETMQLGGLAGLTALTMGLGQKKTIRGEANSEPAAIASLCPPQPAIRLLRQQSRCRIMLAVHPLWSIADRHSGELQIRGAYILLPKRLSQLCA